MEPPRKKTKQHYRTVQQAIRDGWPDTLQGIDLTVSNYNLLGDLAAELFRANPGRDAAEVRKVAINAFVKRLCVPRKGKWVVSTTYTLASGLQFPNPRAPQPNLEKANRGQHG